ncbi:SDR family NAD(P)-dependent oxidoreductase [Streptomyces sp. NPDC127036]|uniref:SDR family NAD(P)-dependent oxidoreductase n=1 Tax=Streptomyces sp. NPDC127036 TaxID=3347112 RepID=UPI0036496749
MNAALDTGVSIAVVGMAGRFPQSANVDEFWAHCIGGDDCVTRWDAGQETPGRVPAGGLLEDADAFDAAFFGVSPSEAEILDPQNRVFLELSWEALESAAVVPGQAEEVISVYAASAPSRYRPTGGEGSENERYQHLIGNSSEFLATRVAYLLDLHGEAISVQAGCSSSLVAVHLAAQNLRAGLCDIALAGGVSFDPDQHSGYAYEEGMISSPDGRCRPFDVGSNGTVPSNGAGVVVLQRLEDAIAQRRPIQAVIRATATNNDGRAKSSFMAPTVQGQSEVVATALAMSQVEAENIGYYEAHGTGTRLGDPIEIEAATRAYELFTDRTEFAALGSLKANFGHLDRAAGVAGLIKVVCAVRDGVRPPLAGFREANAELDFTASPFRVPLLAEPWSERTRIAAVSSFGVGGTNAHAIVERYVPVEAEPAQLNESRPLVLPLSAHDAPALRRRARALATRLAHESALPIGAVAHTLAGSGRATSRVRATVVARSSTDAVDMLRGLPPVDEQCQRLGGDGLVLTFPGQAGRPGAVVQDLYARFPAFRNEIDCCASELDLTGTQLLTGLNGPIGNTGRHEGSSGNPYQPAHVAVEIAYARLLAQLGLQTDAAVGSSLGEFAAAHVAGIFERGSLMRLLRERDRLMRTAASGVMCAVDCGVTDVVDILGPELSLAADNAPDRIVLAGTEHAVSLAERALSGRGFRCRRLPGAIAFHSPLMDEVIAPFREAVRRAAPQPPDSPIVSTLTGDWLTPEAATDPDYWVRQLREPIQIRTALGTLLSSGHRRYVEAGPGTALTGLVLRNSSCEPLAISVAGSDGKAGFTGLAQSLGALWQDGVDLDWDKVNGTSEEPFATLPGHVFDRSTRYWSHQPDKAPAEGAQPDHLRPMSVDAPQWRVSPRSRTQATTETSNRACLPARVAVITRGSHLAEVVTEKLTQAGVSVLGMAVSGPADAVLDLTHAEGKTDEEIDLRSSAKLDAWLERGLWNPTRELLARGQAARRLLVVTRRLMAVAPHEVPDAGAAAVLGLVRCAPHDLPGVRAHLCDLDDAEADVAANAIIGELADPDARDVAYRSGTRFTAHYASTTLGVRSPLKDGGTYLVLGGTGRLGAVVADAISSEVAATVFLAGRNPHRPLDASRQVLLDAAARRGCTIHTIQLDVTNESELRTVLAELTAEFGRVDGIFHLAGHTDTAAFSLLEEIAETRTSEVAEAKVRGAATLANVLRGLPCDFVVLFSSISTVLGALSFGPYVSANAYLDALAVRERASTGVPWTSICWDGWHENLSTADDALGAEDGSWLLRRALRATAPVVVAAVNNTENRRAKMLGGLARVARTAATAGEASSSDTLRIILETVEKVLGRAPEDLDVSLNRLGADSLQMMQIAARLRTSLDVDISLASLIRAQSVREMESVCMRDTPQRTARAETALQKADVTRELASVQQRLWYLWQFDPEEVNYNVPFGWRYADTEPGRVEDAVRALVERHPTLRTSYDVDAAGAPERRITAPEEVPLESILLTGVTEEECEAEFLRCAGAFIRRPFDLTRASVRVLIAGSSLGATRVLLVCHHVAVDAWSVELIRSDLEVLIVEGPGALSVPLDASYDDFVEAEQAFRHSDEYDRQLSYWQSTTQDIEPVAPSADFAETSVASGSAGEVRHTLAPDVLTRLRHVAKQQDTTLYTLALTALTIALAEWCRRDEVVLGTNLANRNLPGLESVVGMFVDPVVLRVHPLPKEGAGTWKASLKAVSEAFLSALDHSELPYQEVVSTSGHGGRGAQNPLFSVIATMFDAQAQSRPAGPLEAQSLALPMQSRVKFSLSVEFFPGPTGLAFQVLYPADRYRLQTVEKFVQRIAWLLNTLAEQGPGSSVGAPAPVRAVRRARFTDRFTQPGPTSFSASETEPVEAVTTRTPHPEGVTR